MKLSEGGLVTTWDKIISDFYATHADHSQRFVAEAELKNIVQGKMTVREFYRTIENQARLCNLGIPVRAYIFRLGLNQDVMERIDHATWNSTSAEDLDALYRLAETAETHLKEIKTHGNVRTNKRPTESGDQGGWCRATNSAKTSAESGQTQVLPRCSEDFTPRYVHL